MRGRAIHQCILFIASTRSSADVRKAKTVVQMVITRDYPAVIDQIFVENPDFFGHHLHSMPPLFVVVYR